MGGLLDRIGEMLGLKKKPSTTAAAEPAEPMPTTAQVPSDTRPGDENPDAAPTGTEDVEADDPRKDTPTE